MLLIAGREELPWPTLMLPPTRASLLPLGKHMTSPELVCYGLLLLQLMVGLTLGLT
jgi:hypothetical protein